MAPRIPSERERLFAVFALYLSLSSLTWPLASRLAGVLAKSQIGALSVLWSGLAPLAPLAILGRPLPRSATRAPAAPLSNHQAWGIDVLVGVAWGAAIGLVAHFASHYLLSRAESPWGMLALVDVSRNASVYVAIAEILVSGVVVAPVVEEVYFRGALLHALRADAGRYGAAVLSAAVFALSHRTGAMMIAAFVLGIGNALIVEWRRNFVGVVAAHATANAILTIRSLSRIL